MEVMTATSKSAKQLFEYQDEIKRMDPCRSDLRLYVAERLHFIIKHEMYGALGYKSKSDYLEDSMELFAIKRASCYSFLKAYKALFTYQRLFAEAELDFVHHREALIQRGLFTKLLLLKNAMTVHVSRDVSETDVFKIFLSYSYREFRLYVYPLPSDRRENNWKNKLKEWNEIIRKEHKKTGLVKLIPYDPHTVSRDSINMILENLPKEVHK